MILPPRTFVVLYLRPHQDVLHGREAPAAAVHHLGKNFVGFVAVALGLKVGR